MAEDVELFLRVLFRKIVLRLPNRYPHLLDRARPIWFALVYAALLAAVFFMAKKAASGARRTTTSVGIAKQAGIAVRGAIRILNGRLKSIPTVMRPQITSGYRLALFVMTATLSIACAGDHGHNFYILLRFAVTGVALTGVVRFFRMWHLYWRVVVGGIALMFNPIAPLFFNRDTWKALDFLAALVALALAVVGRVTLVTENLPA